MLVIAWWKYDYWDILTVIDGTNGRYISNQQENKQSVERSSGVG